MNFLLIQVILWLIYIINAINSIFPDLKIHSCFFHFSQAIYGEILKNINYAERVLMKEIVIVIQYPIIIMLHEKRKNEIIF